MSLFSPTTSRGEITLYKTRTPFHGQTQGYGCEGRVERLVDLVTKVVMDHAVLPLDLGDDLTDVGVETGMPLVGAAGQVVLQMGHRVRQGTDWRFLNELKKELKG